MAKRYYEKTEGAWDTHLSPSLRSVETDTNFTGDGTASSPLTASGSFVKSYDAGEPLAADTNGVHAAIALTDALQTITTGITNPDVPRCVSITGNASGIAGDVTITGTNFDDAAISEVIALNGDNTVGGEKAFKTVVSIALPIETHAGTDTVEIGFTDSLGLPDMLTRNSVLWGHIDGTRDGITPSVTFDSNELEKNVVLLDTALDGSAVIIDYYL